MYYILCTVFYILYYTIRGSCETCACRNQWSGDRCETCKDGWGGADCDWQEHCSADRECSGHGDSTKGTCEMGWVCQCDEGWFGPACLDKIEGLVSKEAAAILSVTCVLCTAALLAKVAAHPLLKIEVFLSTLDVSSDAFWALTEAFYHTGFTVMAFFLVLGSSFVHVGLAYVRQIPPSTLALSKRVAMAGIQYAQNSTTPTIRIFGMLRTQGCSPVYKTVDGELLYALANLGATSALVIALIVATIMSMITATLAITLSSVLASALALVATAAIFIAGILMHSARVLILKSAHAKYLSLWQGGVTVADDGDQIDPALYNRVMLGELMLECLPSLALNITNMTMMNAVYGVAPSWMALWSAACSSFMVLRLLFRFAYYMGHKRVPLSEVRLPGGVGTGEEAKKRESRVAGTAHVTELALEVGGPSEKVGDVVGAAADAGMGFSAAGVGVTVIGAATAVTR